MPYILKILLKIKNLLIFLPVPPVQVCQKGVASAGNRTRAARVAGEHSTTEPPMPTECWAFIQQKIIKPIKEQY